MVDLRYRFLALREFSSAGAGARDPGLFERMDTRFVVFLRFYVSSSWSSGVTGPRNLTLTLTRKKCTAFCLRRWRDKGNEITLCRFFVSILVETNRPWTQLIGVTFFLWNVSSVTGPIDFSCDSLNLGAEKEACRNMRNQRIAMVETFFVLCCCRFRL